MCKYYGHHLICWTEENLGECDYNHNENVRNAFDMISLSRENGIPCEKIPIEKIRNTLDPNYNLDNPEDCKSLLWKEYALQHYARKPTYREREK